MSKNRRKGIPKTVHFTGLMSILTALNLFPSEVHADTQRTPFTRWQAVRFTRFEGSELFRIDILELTDRNPPRSDTEELTFPVDGEERKRTLERSFRNFENRGEESSERGSSNGTQMLDGKLFTAKESEGTVKQWGRSLNWHRYSLLTSDGDFDMKFDKTNSTVTASGSVVWNPKGKAKLDKLAFRKEHRENRDKWESWGVDMQNDMCESVDYFIVGSQVLGL